MNGHPLGCCTSLVLITSNLELLRELPDTLRDVVDGLHRIDIGLEYGNFEVLGLGFILGRPSIHLHLLPRRVRERRFEEELDLTALSFNDCIGLVKLDTFLEESVHFGASHFLSEFFFKNEPGVLRNTTILQAFDIVLESGIVCFTEQLLKLCPGLRVEAHTI